MYVSTQLLSNSIYLFHYSRTEVAFKLFKASVDMLKYLHIVLNVWPCVSSLMAQSDGHNYELNVTSWAFPCQRIIPLYIKHVLFLHTLFK
jgi:hypothetical protein